MSINKQAKQKTRIEISQRKKKRKPLKLIHGRKGVDRSCFIYLFLG